jgi:hypothetical protein
MNESLIKYLAGLLDADGNLSFDKHTGQDGRIRISLKLGLVSAASIDRHGFVPSLPALTGMGSVTQTYGKYNCWSVCHRADLEMLLPRLVKHMVIKAKHWQWMLEYWRGYRSQERGSKSLSEQEWLALSEQSKQSRKENVGPLKPKNHPTWAWVAGYLDGDGCYSFRTSKNNNMRLSVTAHINDAGSLTFLQNAFGGTIKEYSGKPHIKVWWRGLGPANRDFALKFLGKLVNHSRLKKHKLEQMISFHHRQRLSVSTATADAIV